MKPLLRTLAIALLGCVLALPGWGQTLLDVAKAQGFATAYFYAKPKLGYLVSDAIDTHALARDDGIERAQAFFQASGSRFVFLHLSGLDEAGPDTGWLSREYLDELRYIDRSLQPLLTQVRGRGAYVILLTSDHAGHDRLHGTNHPDPEDFKISVILEASQPMPGLVREGMGITQVKSTLQRAMKIIRSEP